MCIFEYDEALHMKQERSSSYAEGRVEGREEGKEEKIIQVILKSKNKLDKDTLASILDIDIPKVEAIMNLSDLYPDKSAEEIMAMM